MNFSEIENFKPNFFLVWREGSDHNTPTYKHDNYASAKAEAERLAKQYGGEFHVMACVASVENVQIQIKEHFKLMPF